MTLEEAYNIPQLQYDIEKIVLKHGSRIDYRRDELNRFFRANNVYVILSKTIVRKLLHSLKE